MHIPRTRFLLPGCRLTRWLSAAAWWAAGCLIAAHAGTHPPAGTSRVVSMLPSTSYVLQSGDFGFSDTGDSPADAFIAVKINTLPSLGTLTLDGVAAVAGQLVAVSDITAGKLVYTPLAGATGTPYASLDFQVQDNGSGNSNSVTLLTNQAVIATALNTTQTATAALPTPTYPALQVQGQYLSGTNSWGTFQPGVVTATSTLFGASVTFPTRYLDAVGSPSARTSRWTFQTASGPTAAAALATTNRTFTYVVGVAGLGGAAWEDLSITSDVMLTVVGNGDAFNTNAYSLLDGVDTNGALGLTGHVISTATPKTTSQGYTFFSLPANVSSVTLTEAGDDPHGVVLGVVETTLATLDPAPKNLAFHVAAAAPAGQAAAIPSLSHGGWLLLSVALAAIAARRVGRLHKRH